MSYGWKRLLFADRLRLAWLAAFFAAEGSSRRAMALFGFTYESSGLAQKAYCREAMKENFKRRKASIEGTWATW